MFTFIGGIVGGVISTIVYYYLTKLKKSWEHAEIYRIYEGKYFAYKKGDFENKDKVLEINIIRKGNVLILEGNNLKEQLTDEDRFSGKISFDDKITHFGKGYYQHKDFKGGYGFIDAQLCQEVILVHIIWFWENEKRPEGYIWVKQD